jgi:hypothetical protein
MNLAYTMQNFQDWFTQQWVILWGRKINPSDYAWLLGPFGEINGIGENFIYQLAKKENLIVERNSESKGLLSSIDLLKFSEEEIRSLSQEVIHFYEHTAQYHLQFQVQWNPFFKGFGYLVNRLFSQRINQLNIPTENIKTSESLSSEIIALVSPETNETKYTIWLRKYPSTGRVIYSGIYGTTQLPSGKICVKAVFPLPKGNATVILKPSVGKNHELILDSSGKRFGDAGFYFLLNDAKGNNWAQFISSFTDQLIVSKEKESLCAVQTLKLWGMRVSKFSYVISNNT